MSIEGIQKTIAEQKKQLDKTAEELKTVPEDIKSRQQKILDLVKDELTAIEKELDKYTDKK